MTDLNLRMARVCEEMGYCTPEQAQRAADLARQLQDLGRLDDVVSILIEQGAISPEAAFEVRQAVPAEESAATATFDQQSLEAARSGGVAATSSFDRKALDAARASATGAETAAFDQETLDAARAGGGVAATSSFDRKALDAARSGATGEETAAFDQESLDAARSGGTVAETAAFEQADVDAARALSTPVDGAPGSDGWQPEGWLNDPTEAFNRADLDAARTNRPEVTAAFSDADLKSVMSSPSAKNTGRMASLDAAALEQFEKSQFGRDLEGLVLGGCRLEREIGRGAMAVVYEATQIALDRKVAVKVLMPSALRRGSSHDQFVREARSLAKIDHANIVQVQDVGSEQNLSYIVMQLLDGENLAQHILVHTKLDWKKACEIALGMAEGLAVAHEQGVVHRDIKPANVLLTGDGIPKIADFGLAAQFSEAGHEGDQVMGTPAYMSPEQIDGRAVDGRSDLYSLGCTLYELLCGRKPFTGSHALEVVLKQTIEIAVPVDKVDSSVPETVSRVVQKCMAKHPDARYPTAQELAADLRNVLGGGKPQVVGEIEDVISRMERLISAAPQPGSRFQPAPVVVAALVVIAATVIGVSIALPAVHGDMPKVDLPSTGASGQSRSETARDQLNGVEEFARSHGEAWEEIDRRYQAVRADVGDMLGETWAMSYERSQKAFEKLRAEELEKVLRWSGPQVRSSQPSEGVLTLLDFPEGYRVGEGGKAWHVAHTAAIARVIEVHGMAFVPNTPVEGQKASGFLLDLTEVSNSDYAEFVAATKARAPAHWDGAKPPSEVAKFPVVGVTATEAEAYAKWKGKRLPTSDEWSLAARGPQGWKYPWGNQFEPHWCVARGSNGGQLSLVRSHQDGRTPTGLFHMAGNAMEWTSTASTNPIDGVGRVVRGGSMRSHPQCVTSEFLSTLPPDSSDPTLYVGFRCARDGR